MKETHYSSQTSYYGFGEMLTSDDTRNNVQALIRDVIVRFFQDPETTGGVHDCEMLDPGNTTSRVARDVPDHDAGDSSPLSVFTPY